MHHHRKASHLGERCLCRLYLHRAREAWSSCCRAQLALLQPLHGCMGAVNAHRLRQLQPSVCCLPTVQLGCHYEGGVNAHGLDPTRREGRSQCLLCLLQNLHLGVYVLQRLKPDVVAHGLICRTASPPHLYDHKGMSYKQLVG